jgi:hypothetical protein
MRLFLVCLVIAGCSNGKGSDDSGDDAPPPDAGSGSNNPTPVTPRAGGWEYDEVTPVSSTCPGNIQQGGTGNFAIDQSSTTSFHVVPADGTPNFTCTLNGSAYECPDRLTNTQDLRPTVDAVFTARAVARGTFASAVRATGSQDATVTCAGTQCNATGAVFPCTVKVNFSIRAR